MTARQELAPVFLTASNSLKTAMNAAATRDATEKQQDAIFDGWEMKTKNTIKKAVVKLDTGWLNVADNALLAKLLLPLYCAVIGCGLVPLVLR